MVQDIKVCKKCVLKSSIPGISINKDGLCSECVRYERIRKYIKQTLATACDKNKHNVERGSNMYVKKMEELFEQAKKKKRMYDVIVPFSGGKDCAYVLYLLKKKYVNGFRFKSWFPKNGGGEDIDFCLNMKSSSKKKLKTLPSAQVQHP